MDLKPVFEASNKYFPKISPYKDNAAVMRDTLEIDRLCKRMVSELKTVEQEGINWWENKALFGVIDCLYSSGAILLPLDLVDRVRWIALVCVAVSIQENYSFENVLCGADYLPSENMTDRDSGYDDKLVKNILKFRSSISSVGWQSLCGLR
jgi:hypothetical protein